MSRKILPYHFVPAPPGPRRDDLRTETFRQNPPEHLGQHVYAPETYSGRLICRLTTVSPLVVGAERRPADDGEETPAEVEPFRIGERPAVPGSTLRGLISSTAEAISGSSLRILDHSIYSYRSKADPRSALRSLGEIVVEEGEEGPAYSLRSVPCAFRFDKKHVTRPLQSWCRQAPTYYGVETSKHPSLPTGTVHAGTKTKASGKVPLPVPWDQLNPRDRSRYTKGVVRVMEAPQVPREDLEELRRWELFLPYDPLEKSHWPTLPIPLPVVDCFHQLADERTDARRDEAGPPLPYEPIGTRRNAHPEDADDRRFRLKTGDLVYYSASHGEVDRIALSAIWRERVEDPRNHEPFTSWDFFEALDPDLVPFHEQRQNVTLAEQLFGFVAEEPGDDDTPRRQGTTALKSRVRVSDAHLDDAFDLRGVLLPKTTLQILASPKPPSPSLYFTHRKPVPGAPSKQALDPAKHAPQGRKMYVHQRYDPTQAGETPWSAAQENHLQAEVTPVGAKTSFTFHIDVDNLTARELGLLLCALNPSDAFLHKLGMGKSLGLGSVRLDLLAFCEVDRQSRYQATGLFAPRYGCVHRPAGAPPSWPERYDREQQATTNQDTDRALHDLRRPWRELTPLALRRLGEEVFDPDDVGWPEVDPKQDDDKSFEWFVSNDDQDPEKRLALKPLTEGSWPGLATLPKKSKGKKHPGRHGRHSR